MRSIADVAADLGLSADETVPAGPNVLKVPLGVVRARAATGRRGQLILVTAMTPTSHGEGKTVVSIGLAMALNRLGRKAVVCLRQPSLGPVFGLKGGAAGGGRSTVEPAREVDLGLTGDLSAIADAHNLLASLIDNHLFHGNALDLERSTITWPRTLDLEDRALRRVVVDASGGPRDLARETQFVIAPASELTAIHGLTRDIPDLKARLGRVLIGTRGGGLPARAGDVSATGAMAVLMRRTLQPNLLQTAEGTPALVHGGPFANIAHGTTTRLSIELALATSEFAVVEAGFSTELGAEKFVDIVARSAGFAVGAAVLIATVRGLRRQGGAPEEALATPNAATVTKGLPNLVQHVENLRALGLLPVLALNRFPGDTSEEIAVVERWAASQGVPIESVTPFADGGAGAEALAKRILAVAGTGPTGHPLYPEGASIPEALTQIATRLYGAKEVRLSAIASSELAELEAWGETTGPVCVAKTPLSLSDDPHVVGRPKDLVLTVRRLWRAAGAGFTVAYLGEIETMPGLPGKPRAEHYDLSDDGEVLAPP